MTLIVTWELRYWSSENGCRIRLSAWLMVRPCERTWKNLNI